MNTQIKWFDIRSAYYELVESLTDPNALNISWCNFRELVARAELNRPYHLRHLIQEIESYRGDRARSEIAILDHGCGGGLTLLYLAALNYTNSYGVDVGDSNYERLNTLFAQVLGIIGPRFFVYDGHLLPLDDDAIDVVFSQQVLEHVQPNVLESYYAEEHRVLKRDGLAFHQIPHRLVPYDSHTRTWFLHCILPRRLWIWSLKVLGRDTNAAYVFLRWPWAYNRLARRYFGQSEDFTLRRLHDLRPDSFDHYDGSIRLRRFISRLALLPVVGSCLARFVMMDTVSRNRA